MRTVWAIPGIAVWAVLQIIAVRVCTGWRDEKVKYGLVVLVLLAWWLPDSLFGRSGALEVEQLLLIVGFPIAAIYLGGLLIAEWVERKQEKLKAES